MGKLKKSSPAFFALFILLVVELIDLSGIVPVQRRGNFENISNAVMVVITVAGFLIVGLPFKERSNDQIDKDERVFAIFGNLAVSFITFPMNVSVFGHPLRQEQLLADIWGWHLFWIICVVIQILILSGLGERLLDEVLVFGGWLRNDVFRLLNSILHKAPTIITRNKMVSICFLIWSIYFVAQVCVQGIASVFSDANIFWNSLCLWMAVITIFFLIYITPLLFSKCKEAIKNISGKNVLAAVIAVVFITLANILPSLLKTIALLLLIPAIPAILIGFIIRRGIYKIRELLAGLYEANQSDQLGNQSANTVSNYRDIETADLYMKYVAVLLVCFIVFPLAIIILTIAIRNGWNDFPIQDITSITAWLEFFKVVSETAGSLLKLLG